MCMVGGSVVRKACCGWRCISVFREGQIRKGWVRLLSIFPDTLIYDCFIGINFSFILYHLRFLPKFQDSKSRSHPRLLRVFPTLPQIPFLTLPFPQLSFLRSKSLSLSTPNHNSIFPILSRYKNPLNTRILTQLFSHHAMPVLSGSGSGAWRIQFSVDLWLTNKGLILGEGRGAFTCYRKAPRFS